MMEEPYELPEGWVWTTLGEICSKPQYGWTASADPKKDGLKLLRTTDISSGSINWSTVPGSSKFPEDIEKYKLKHGDIVVSRAGSVGINMEITDCPNAIFASYLIRFNAISPIPSRYISLFLKTPYYWSSIVDNTAGIAIPNVNATKLANLKIPFPPLPEQHRIVAKLEAFLAQVNTSKDHLAKVTPLIKRFRQSVLAAACSGRLTEDWRRVHPDVEPASKLLKRIHEERIRRYERECRKAEAEGRRKPKKPQNLEPQEMETAGLPELPEGWVWCKLGEVCEINPKSTNLSDFDQSLLTTFVPMAAVDQIEGTIKTPEILPLGKARKGHTQFIENDVIFARITPCMENGKAAIAKSLENCLGFGSTEFHVIRPLDEILPEYIFYFIRQESFRNKASAHFTSTVGQMRVPKEFIIAISIPLPTLPEQRVIVNRVENIFRFADEVEQRVAAATTHANQLTKTLRAKAFRGELVPQDPNDEPATVLLERIKKEKAEQKEMNKAQKRKSKTLLDFN